MKTCRTCLTEHTLSHFYAAPNNKDGLSWHCKKCISTYGKSYRRKPHIQARIRAAELQRKYGISSDEAKAILASQGGCCAICSSGEPGGRGDWHVDHCHASGRVRGLLCSTCNVGLGMFKDDEMLLINASRYLRNVPHMTWVEAAAAGRAAQTTG